MPQVFPSNNEHGRAKDKLCVLLELGLLSWTAALRDDWRAPGFGRRGKCSRKDATAALEISGSVEPLADGADWRARDEALTARGLCNAWRCATPSVSAAV